LKELTNKLKIVILLSLISNFVFSQSDTNIKDTILLESKLKIDTSSISSFRNNKVLYADLGFNTAPFSIRFRDALGEKQNLYYRNNLRSVFGFGFSYKWISLRLAVNLPGHLKPVSKFGKTKYIDLGFEFKTKKRFFDIDIHDYRGYAIKHAYKWDSTLNKSTNPHYISEKTQAFSFSVNSWRFFNNKIVLNALRGKTAMYTKKEQSFYLKSTFNIHGIANNSSLIPTQLVDTLNSKTGAKNLAALDFGILPGYVYVDRINNFQFSGMIGFGPVLQYKSYTTDEIFRSFVGLAPRIDIRLNIGYNVEKYFINLITEFDNKSIRYNDLSYRQTFYMIKLVGGLRF
jgi:hypothetical protein